MVNNPPAKQETWVPSLALEDPLEKGKATQFSIFAGKSHGQRSLAGYSPWNHTELDTTEHEHTHTQNYEHIKQFLTNIIQLWINQTVNMTQVR